MWDLNKLAVTLKELTPKAIKDGKWAYADGVSAIKNRLTLFVKKFPEIAKTYSETQVIEAYKKYLKDTTNFDGTISKYRRLLKYFLWRAEPDGDTSSVLANYLENDMSELETVHPVDEKEIDWMDEII